MCLQPGRDQGAETSGQERPGHVGEREQQQCSSTESVNGPHGRESEQEIDETETPRGPQCLESRESRVGEDGGGVEGNDVDTAHLLGNHNGERGESCTADTRNGEELDETGEVVVVANHLGLNLELCVNGIEIASGLDGVVTESQERAHSLGVSVPLCISSKSASCTRLEKGLRRYGARHTHAPTWRFRAEVDAQHQRDGWDHGGSELESPGNLASMGHGQVCAVSKEDTEGGPQLPGHDQSTTDSSWSIFCGENGDGGTLSTHSESQEKTADEELLPCLGARRTNDGQETEDSSNEDGTTTTKEVVQGIRNPAAKESRTDVWSRVDETKEQSIVIALASDTEDLGEGQIGTIGTRLIPTLHSGTDGAEHDGQIQGPGMAPLVEDLVAEGLDLRFGQSKLALDVFIVGGVLRNQSALLQDQSVLGEALLLGESLNISQKLVARDSGQRVFDPALI